jgi:diadenosine tetraphosphate (Ap4A) HIT family hydrolase
MAATGVPEYNVLENNGPGAHQVVRHVHFHIIPKPDAAQGLGIGWPAGSIDADAAALAEQMRAAL